LPPSSAARRATSTAHRCSRSKSGCAEAVGVPRTNCRSPASSSRCATEASRLGRRRRAAAAQLRVVAARAGRSHYAAVADWVDRTHLGRRLVYFRVREPRAATLPDLHPQSLVRKLSVRPESAFYGWLEQELARRFDYACCADLERVPPGAEAVTRRGRSRAPMPATRRTTGTASTIAPATCSAGATPTSCAPCATSGAPGGKAGRARQRIGEIQQARKELRRPAGDARKLEEFTRFADIDWRARPARLPRSPRSARGWKPPPTRCRNWGGS
jgi:hypothetical protein